ncbi:MAG: hypothetical protein ACYCS1_10170 [Gammaproteobacteria bacterium]
MTRFDEDWIKRMREVYEHREREMPPEVFQALARARNRALGGPVPRFFRPLFFMPAVALLAAVTLAVFFWIRLPVPGPSRPQLSRAAQMLTRESPKLYEHLAFYRWLADHPTQKVG